MAFATRLVMGSFSPSYHLHPSAGPFVHRRKHVLRCHTLTSQSNYSSISTTTVGDLDSKFMQVYDSLKSELFCDPSFEFDEGSRQWVERIIDYNVPGGKLNRIRSVVDTYKLLKGEQPTDDELFLACALGWCAEWLHAYILITDDIIDASHTRRGRPCWFRLPEVGLVAVNDALVLRNHVAIILKKHFKEKAYYVDLLELFNEVEYQTTSGQMIDMITTLVGEKIISKCCWSTNQRVLQYKTSYGTFYLPIACALLMFGENLSDHIQVKDVLVKMGIYFSVQDDYLDAYGDPKVTGKIGVDIENFKCSSMVAKALELANEEQKKILNENYGIKDPVKVAKVKELYNALNLKSVYEDYEKKTHQELITSIEAHPNKAIQAVLKSFLRKIYKRQK